MSAEFITYLLTFLVCLGIVLYYILKHRSESRKVAEKVALAKETGKFIPVSLHPYIDPNVCIGSGACVRSCPEEDILGLVNSAGTVINASSCIGHGACFQACPVDAISLRIGTELRGVDLPHVKPSYETNVEGIYIAGELGGMGLIRNSAEQGIQAVDNIVKSKGEHGLPYDLIIVGAGPAGIAASLKAKEAGLNFKLLDQDTLGGTVFTFPRSKVVMTRPMNLPLYGKLKLVNTSKDELLSIWQDALSKNEISVQEHSKVDFIEAISGGFELHLANGNKERAHRVLLAIGRRGTPRKLGVPGEGSQKVAYRLLEPERIEKEKILVVGGGDSAVESALLLCDRNEVILSYRKENFARIKPGNEKKLNEAIANGQLNVMLNSNVKEILNEKVIIENSGSERVEVLNDRVYIFIGGELPISFLEKSGIQVDKHFGKIVKKHGRK